MIKEHYLKTVFIAKQPAPDRWPEAFAVITACNPLGRIIDDGANQSANMRLRKTLSRLGVKRHRVTGMSPDMIHREPSFAVWGCDLGVALDLGKQFSQHAIFWVENGKLDVVSCITGEREHEGLWSERLREPGEKPKLCCVYVIELAGEARTIKRVREANPNANPKMKCVYVGSTARTPEQRFEVHKAGGKQSSSIVRRHGVRLVPGLYRNFPLMPRAQAEDEEARLANQLRAKGYTVWQN